MGTRFINIPASSRLGSFSSQFFFCFFFFSAKMNLTVFAGILLAVTMATARRASSGEKTMQAAGKADEPEEAMREAARPASLVEKIMRAADEANEPDEAKRAKRACKSEGEPCTWSGDCCLFEEDKGGCWVKEEGGEFTCNPDE